MQARFTIVDRAYEVDVVGSMKELWEILNEHNPELYFDKNHTQRMTEKELRAHLKDSYLMYVYERNGDKEWTYKVHRQK